MIDEETLTNLLGDYARTVPVPDSAIGELLDASPEARRGATPTRLNRRSSRALAAAAAVVVVLSGVWAVTAHHDHTSAARASLPVTRPVPQALVRSRVGMPSLRSTNQGGFTSPPKALVPGSGGSNGLNKSTAKPPTDSARVVRTGTLNLTIARHGFGPTIAHITTTVAAEGGFISDQHTYESATTPSGTVELRVPSARFNDTMGRLRALGKVVTASTRGVDVTGQYTDLQARLRAATATRDQFLTVLAKATSIGDILAVQDRIQSVQTQIEQLQGQINDLDNRTTYATITVSVTEPAPKAKPVIASHHRSGLSVAWENARGGFARRVESLISHSGSVVVILVGLLLFALALRLLVPRMRRIFV